MVASIQSIRHQDSAAYQREGNHWNGFPLLSLVKSSTKMIKLLLLPLMGGKGGPRGLFAEVKDHVFVDGGSVDDRCKVTPSAEKFHGEDG